MKICNRCGSLVYRTPIIKSCLIKAGAGVCFVASPNSPINIEDLNDPEDDNEDYGAF